MREGPDSFSPIEGGPTQMPTVSVTQAASDTGEILLTMVGAVDWYLSNK